RPWSLWPRAGQRAILFRLCSGRVHTLGFEHNCRGAADRVAVDLGLRGSPTAHAGRAGGDDVGGNVDLVNAVGGNRVGEGQAGDAYLLREATEGEAAGRIPDHRQAAVLGQVQVVAQEGHPAVDAAAVGGLGDHVDRLLPGVRLQDVVDPPYPAGSKIADVQRGVGRT